MEITKDTTRIDLERLGESVMVSIWNGKWEEGSQPARYEYLQNAMIVRLLQECESAGFTVEMCDNDHGRALRGEITRIDIMQIGKSWKVRKYPRGWTAKTRPLTEREMTDDEAKTAIQWCMDNRWTVREFPGGARAWKGEAKPVRDRSTIMRMRRQIDEHFQRSEIDSRRQFDLAFDC